MAEKEEDFEIARNQRKKIIMALKISTDFTVGDFHLSLLATLVYKTSKLSISCRRQTGQKMSIFNSTVKPDGKIMIPLSNQTKNSNLIMINELIKQTNRKNRTYKMLTLFYKKKNHKNISKAKTVENLELISTISTVRINGTR